VHVVLLVAATLIGMVVAAPCVANDYFGVYTVCRNSTRTFIICPICATSAPAPC
jgi:hypothetical protein